MSHRSPRNITISRDVFGMSVEFFCAVWLFSTLGIMLITISFTKILCDTNTTSVSDDIKSRNANDTEEQNVESKNANNTIEKDKESRDSTSNTTAAVEVKVLDEYLSQPEDVTTTVSPTTKGNSEFKIRMHEPPSSLHLLEEPNQQVYHEPFVFRTRAEQKEDKNNNGTNNINDATNKNNDTTVKDNNDMPQNKNNTSATKNSDQNHQNNGGIVDKGEVLGATEGDLYDEIHHNEKMPANLPARTLVEMYEQDVNPLCKDAQYTLHDHNTDVYDVEKANAYTEASSLYESARGRFWRILKLQIILDQPIPDGLIQKQLQLISDQAGFNSLKYSQIQALQISKLYLEESFRERTVPNYNRGKLPVYIHKVEEVLRHPNTTYDQKLHYWRQWHYRVDNLSMHMDNVIAQYTMMAAKNQGLSSGSEVLKKPYETADLKGEVDRVWSAIQPLYTLLRRYVQRVLKDKYKGFYKYSGWLLPAHMTGSVSGGDWTFLYQEAKLYPCSSADSIQTILNHMDYCSASQIFKNSMTITEGIIDCNHLFDVRTHDYPKSDCTPKLYEFCDGVSYIIFVCDNHLVNFDFGKEFEKMFYAMQYHNQPFLFRNPHPVIRDALSSLLTTQVFRFGAESRMSEEASLNHLLYEALYFLPRMASAMALTKFSWRRADNVMDGARSWNDVWWDYKYKYEGIDKPENFQSGQYDPAGNYYLSLGIDKTSDILSPVVMYQVLRSLCDPTQPRFRGANNISTHIPCTKGPKRDLHNRQTLHQCNLFGKTDVGAWIKYIQSQGRSKDWREILQETTGSGEIDPKAMLEYFRPLEEFLYSEDPDSQQGLWILLWIAIAVLILVMITAIFICSVKRRSAKSMMLNQELGAISRTRKGLGPESYEPVNATM